MIELSAFGPGYGESLLVHLGAGEWMIVDSCRSRVGALPALDYLEAMKLKPADVVKLVVATHWHDDHVRGIAEVLKACPSAQFVCTAALWSDELDLLTALASIPERADEPITSGVKEMRSVLDHLVEAGQRHRLIWALQQRTLLEAGAGAGARRVVALAPSDVILGNAYRRIAELLREGLTRRVPAPDRNLGAIVLWVEAGDATMLLGADLQETTEVHTGWTAVVGCCTAAMGRRSELFKVPHHGSSNAHQDQVWRDLLVERPQAVVCPHERGRNCLPTPDDLARLCRFSDNNLHLTAPAWPRVTIRRGRQRHQTVPDFGRVTLRRRVGEGPDWAVTYDPPAGNGCRGQTPGIPSA